MWKQSRNTKNKKCIGRYFTSLFSHFAPPFRFSHFVPGSAFAQKLTGFHGLFFCGINKTQNAHEIQKVYSKCFLFCGVFCENIRKIPAKCEVRKVYSQPAVYSSRLVHHAVTLWCHITCLYRPLQCRPVWHKQTLLFEYSSWLTPSTTSQCN